MRSSRRNLLRCLALALIVSSLSGCDFLKRLVGKKAGSGSSAKTYAVSADAAEKPRGTPNEETGESYSYSVPGDLDCVPQGESAEGPAEQPGSGVLEGLSHGQQTFWDGRSQSGRTLGGDDGRTVSVSEKPPCSKPKRVIFAAHSLLESVEHDEEPPAPVYTASAMLPPDFAASAVLPPSSAERIVKGGPVLMQVYYKFQQGAYEIAYAVLDRAGWRAKEPSWAVVHHVPARITVHHTEGHRSDTEEDSAETVLGTQELHQSYRIDNTIVSRAEFFRRKQEGEKAHFVKPWADIGYHFLIDGSGRVIQGRPTDLRGSHVANANRGNIGIALMGDFSNQRPTPGQIESLRRLTAFLAAKYEIEVMNPGAFTGHSHYNQTDCPGDRLNVLLDVLRVEIASRSKAGVTV